MAVDTATVVGRAFLQAVDSSGLGAVTREAGKRIFTRARPAQTDEPNQCFIRPRARQQKLSACDLLKPRVRDVRLPCDMYGMPQAREFQCFLLIHKKVRDHFRLIVPRLVAYEHVRSRLQAQCDRTRSPRFQVGNFAQVVNLLLDHFALLLIVW